MTRKEFVAALIAAALSSTTTAMILVWYFKTGSVC